MYLVTLKAVHGYLTKQTFAKAGFSNTIPVALKMIPRSS